MPQLNKKRVVLAMSGGVDSSVAASLLLEEGYDVVGVFMRHGEPTSGCSADPNSSSELPIVDPNQASKQGCCTAQDALDARRISDQLEIPFYALNLEADFRRIVDYFVDEYSAGRTPNPCVMCNNWVKFGKLFDYADSIGAYYVATGHYARLQEVPEVPSPGNRSENGNDPRWMLQRGVDSGKDQSYVLFGIDRSRLDRMLLPVGEFQKSEIRRRAAELGMRVAEKKDSQEICFVAPGQHADFVRDRCDRPAGQGDIVTVDRQVVGTHAGIEGFTIGQRKGLGVAMGEPYFVVRIDASNNQVVIGKREDLAISELTGNRTNWLVDMPTNKPFSCAAQIRYNSTAQPATVTRLEQDRLHVSFDQPVHGVAPGQAVVCYDNDRVLGGGWIE